MPIYEYRCTKCGHQFEVSHAVAETVKSCERCGAPVRRIFSPVGIIFKGPGFHVTDYRKPSDSKTRDSAGGDGKGAGKGTAPAPAAEKTSGETPATATSTGAGKTRS
jgi:putative FmdB family regulatory protein